MKLVRSYVKWYAFGLLKYIGLMHDCRALVSILPTFCL